MKVSDLKQDTKNANKGTARGRDLVAESLKRYGAGRSVLLDKHGRVIAGNKTVSKAAEAGITEVIVIPSDGSQLIAVQRTDLDLDDQKAQALAIADNRTSELGLDWDKDVLADLVGVGDMDLQPFFTDEELAGVLEHAPQFNPATEDEQGKLDEQKLVECPACGNKFHPA